MNTSLDSLIALLNKPSNHVVCFTENASPITHHQFQVDLTKCVSLLEASSYKKFILHCSDSYHFLVNFISLAICDKTIIVTANDKPLWLAELEFDSNENFDCIITDNPHNDYQQPVIRSNAFCKFDNDTKLPEIDGQKLGDTNICFFTSGSSATPKAIIKTFNLLLTELNILQNTFSLNSEQKLIASVSHQHIYGLLFRLLWPFITKVPFQRSMVHYPEQLIEQLKDQNSDNKNSIFVSSPAFLSRLDPDLGKVTVATIFSSGGPLSYAAVQDSQQLLGPLPFEIYGSTETGGIGYRQQTQEDSAWRLFDCIQLHQNNKDQTLLQSPYISQEQIALDDNIILLGDNRFLLQGRKDRVVKLEEKRVSLDEIESHLMTHPQVDQAKVIVLQDKRQYLAAVIQLTSDNEQPFNKENKSVLSKLLKRHCQEKYEAITVPRKWRFVEQLPYNSQGKLLRKDLEQLFKPV